MFDTIRLTLGGVKPDLLNLSTGWNMTTDTGTGEEKRVQKIILLNEADGGKAYNGTIGLTYDYAGQYLNVQCSSLPAMLYGTSLKGLTYEDIPEAEDKLQSIIAPSFYADIVGQAQITRIDNSTVWGVKRRVSDYIGVLDEITPQRQRRSDKKVYDGETIRFDNNSTSVGFYDKVANEEAKRRAHGVDLMAAESNYLRFEIQHKRIQSIRTAYKLEKGQYMTMADLHSEEVAKKTLELRRKTFDRFFPLDEATAYARCFNQFEAIGNMFRTNKGFASVAFFALKTGKMTKQQVVKIAEATGMSRQALSAFRKKIDLIQSIHTDNADIYGEVKQLIYNEGLAA